METADKGGRRLSTDRRQILSEIDFDDRRSGGERRSGTDQRSGLDRRTRKGFRAMIGMDRRKCFKDFSNGQL